MHRLFNHLIVVRDTVNIVELTIDSKLLVVQLELVTAALAVQLIVDIDVLLLREAVLSCRALLDILIHETLLHDTSASSDGENIAAALRCRD